MKDGKPRVFEFKVPPLAVQIDYKDIEGNSYSKRLEVSFSLGMIGFVNANVADFSATLEVNEAN